MKAVMTPTRMLLQTTRPKINKKARRRKKGKSRFLGQMNAKPKLFSRMI
tara:strand:- start:14 stop:160 length:147 start_codon:yes stop_codon:yes gene_type:complete